MPSLATLLVYASPVLLNSTLLGAMTVWEKLYPNSRLNTVYLVLLVLSAAGTLLNAAAGVWCWQQQHQVLAAVYLLLALLPAWLIFKILR